MFIAQHLKNELTVVSEVGNLISNLEYWTITWRIQADRSVYAGRDLCSKVWIRNRILKL